MSRNIVSSIPLFLLLLCGSGGIAAETLRDSLRAGKVPSERFSESELGTRITSYATSSGNPLLLAYYVADGSGSLSYPLCVVRYDHLTRDLSRAVVRGVTTDFNRDVKMDCLGSALQIRETSGFIYIDTNTTPSAGCVILLSQAMEFKTALSGSLLGTMGADYAIVQRSEIHFMSVQPMRIQVFDLKRNRATQVDPFRDDPQRQQFSQLIEPYISQKWCMESNAQCDPENFDAILQGELIANDAAKAFGFIAKFDADGFGKAAAKFVPARTVAYVFREREGHWEHREFDEAQLRSLLNGRSFDEIVRNEPDLPFHAAATLP